MAMNDEVPQTKDRVLVDAVIPDERNTPEQETGPLTDTNKLSP
jgi:hypothetical protein